MQLIPARGRLRDRISLFNSHSDAAYPREGTVTREAHPMAEAIGMQLIPARGRLQKVVRSNLGNVLMQLIPARGRLRRFAVCRAATCRCSLSPRGDGYRRGRKAMADRKIDAAYPREGTVTSARAQQGRCASMQLIPARGRLRHLLQTTSPSPRCSLSPRGDGYASLM